MNQKYSLLCYKFQTTHLCSKMSLQSSVNLHTRDKNKSDVNQQKPRRSMSALYKEKISEASHKGPSCVPCLVTNCHPWAGFPPSPVLPNAPNPKFMKKNPKTQKSQTFFTQERGKLGTLPVSWVKTQLWEEKYNPPKRHNYIIRP